MTDLELIFTMLGEKSTTEIAKTRDAQGFNKNLGAARAGGSVAGVARVQLERETGERVVSSKSFIGKEKRAADPERLQHLKAIRDAKLSGSGNKKAPDEVTGAE
jgi:DNA-damage-inducible protein D